MSQVTLREAPTVTAHGRVYVVLEFRSAVPTKKNKLRPSGRGQRLHYDKELRAQLDDLALQAKVQWGSRPPAVHPEIHMIVVTPDASQDRDGVWTTIQDVLVKARVLPDDSIREFNGKIAIEPAVHDASLKYKNVIVMVYLQ
jgi:hypothetical protein